MLNKIIIQKICEEFMYNIRLLEKNTVRKEQNQMDKDIKDLLLNIQSEVRQINNRLDQVERSASNGDYAYRDTDINSKEYKNMH